MFQVSIFLVIRADNLLVVLFLIRFFSIFTIIGKVVICPLLTLVSVALLFSPLVITSVFAVRNRFFFFRLLGNYLGNASSTAYLFASPFLLTFFNDF